MDYDRNDALLHWLFRQTQGDAWFRPNEENISSGVALRVTDGATSNGVPEFRVFPYENASLEPFETAVAALNPVVAIKVRSAAVHAALAEIAPEDRSIYVDSETRIQILDTMLMLPQADREQCAAFIRDERVMIIWSESLDRIVPLCQDFEDRLIKLLWRSRPLAAATSTTGGTSATGSIADHSSASAEAALSPNGPSGVNGASTPTAPLPSARFRTGSRPASIRNIGGIMKGPYGEQGRSYDDEEVEDEKNAVLSSAKEVTSGSAADPHDPRRRAKRYKRTWYGKKVPVPLDALDLESLGYAASADGRRPVMQWAPLYNGIAAGLALFFVGNGVRTLLMEWRLDGDFTRFALVAVLPLLYCVSLFFCLQIVQNVSMIIGPIAHYHRNSKYYSAVRPRPNKEVDENLPHITIQMPVYKESLETLLPAPDRDERLAFYANHNIGWVARPKHDNAPGGFKRAGRFKKASNMNYGLALSLKMEKCLETLLAERAANKEAGVVPNSATASHFNHRFSGSNFSTFSPGHHMRRQSASASPSTSYGIQYQNRDGDESVVWGHGGAAHVHEHPNAPNANANATGSELGDNPLISLGDEDLEEKALSMAIEAVWEDSGRAHRPWAANGRATRIGEIVLIVDSDTVVPEDCLRDAAREMAASPTVAIVQHESDVMQVAHHYFENGISYFTRRVNRCISISCANGEVAPFMGHNAFLRWKAIQDAAFVDPADGKQKIWSETNVSEDFDMALRLLLRGYIVRWATYSKGGFKEGVSLSVDDELNRWQKYSYGCNELLFNPFIQWWRKGPITRQIHTFLWSQAPLHYKISMMSYMFSYYGIAASITISLINYVLLGFQFPVDGYFMHSFEIFLATTVVFWGSGTLGYTLLEYRLGHKKLLSAFLENLMWIPFFFFFFGGLSIPVTQAILAHFFSYNIQWSATVKEVQRSNFFKEIPKIAKRFWFPMLFSIVVMGGMIVCATPLVPYEYKVDGSAWAVILPLSIAVACHILFPIVLNPWLMVFSY